MNITPSMHASGIHEGLQPQPCIPTYDTWITRVATEPFVGPKCKTDCTKLQQEALGSSVSKQGRLTSARRLLHPRCAQRP